MYSIILTDGTLKNINGDSIEWIERSRMVKIYNNRKVVARINMDNVVGWIESDNIAECENITKGFEDFTKMLFRQGMAESENKE
jgi:hypothetical protein